MPTRIVLASPQHAAATHRDRHPSPHPPPPLLSLSSSSEGGGGGPTNPPDNDSVDLARVVVEEEEDSVWTAPRGDTTRRSQGGGWLTRWFWGDGKDDDDDDKEKNRKKDTARRHESSDAGAPLQHADSHAEYWDAVEDHDDEEESDVLEAAVVNSYDDWDFQELIRLERTLRESLQRRESWLLWSSRHRNTQNGPSPPTERTSRFRLFPQSTRNGRQWQERRRRQERQEEEGRRQGGGRTAHLSSVDIAASPRLIGYIQIFTASLVLLVSAVRFVNRRIDTETAEYQEGALFVPLLPPADAHGILRYKLDYTLYWGVAGASLTFCLIAVHFDNVVAPSLWQCLFSDGSMGEAVLLSGLVLFWMVGIHVCTSAYSMGESQPNVYFSVWFAFLFTLKTVAVWRSSAGLSSWYLWLQTHPRRTSLGWAYVLGFAGLALGSVSDYYLETFVLYPSEPLVNVDEFRRRVRDDEWYMAFGLSGGTLVAAAWALLMNTVLLPLPTTTTTTTTTSTTPAGTDLPTVEQAEADTDTPPPSTTPLPSPPPQDTTTTPSSATDQLANAVSPTTATPVSCVWLLLDWMYVELIMIGGVMGIFAWMIFRYTGITGLSSTPQNPYVSFWGCFFAGIQTLGLWLAENQSKRLLRRRRQERKRKQRQEEEEEEEETAEARTMEATTTTTTPQPPPERDL